MAMARPPGAGLQLVAGMRRAKIVATLGPASSDPDTIQRLFELGVDVARLNFSHGHLEDHADVLDRIRATSRRRARAVGVLQDLQGPKIRTGPLKAGKAGGLLEEHKGINLPGVALRAEALSEKDKRDLAFGLAHGVDYVALSFVRSPGGIARGRAEREG